MEALAHSGRTSQGIAPQPYVDHVSRVRSLAEANIRGALHYMRPPKPSLWAAVAWASVFHDLGKLEPANQAVLRAGERGRLPINHVDAGTAHLLCLRQEEAALAVYAHHVGLPDLPSERAKDQRHAEDPASAALRDYKVKPHTDAELSELLNAHLRLVEFARSAPPNGGGPFSGLERRIALSCLVDADHSDTARHYAQEPPCEPPPTRWVERLASLDSYVRGLSSSDASRDALRSEVYNACRAASPSEPIWACDSPVGTGKTTAVMAYLLRAAVELGLRHILVVLPYISIIQQSVDVYRRALVLPGEDPERVVAAHHHEAEFSAPDARYLATLWDSPIVVTTAVQFFETLGSNEAPRLRKLHQLPGSAVFVDEAHAAMPVHLWPFMWDQVSALAGSWSCRFVLGSGSLEKFWENPRIVGEGRTADVPRMVPEETRLATAAFERHRVRYQSRDDPLDLAGLCDWIGEYSGPRLVVLNTVQSAAVVAREFRRRGTQVLHLSTALAPVHRADILRAVRERLARGGLDSAWLLVATSCVESGLDVSFLAAFRERCRAASLVQMGGRVNRHGERPRGDVWDFAVNDPALPGHPDFRSSCGVVEELFRRRVWEKDTTAVMTYALEQEFKRRPREHKIANLRQQEAQGSYPTVAELTRIISSDTRLVVIDPSLIADLDRRRPVDPRNLISRSVRLWSRRIEKLRLREIGRGSELFAWEYDYDPGFLGVMEGVLKQSDLEAQGCAII